MENESIYINFKLINTTQKDPSMHRPKHKHTRQIVYTVWNLSDNLYKVYDPLNKQLKHSLLCSDNKEAQWLWFCMQNQCHSNNGHYIWY